MKIGVIGCGKMGSALVEGMVRAGVCRGEDLFLHDVFDGAAVALGEKTGGRVCATIAELVEHSGTVLLAVKPQVMDEVLQACRGASGKLLISIAAGIKIGAIEEGSGGGHRVIRVMPNTPALVGLGAAAFARGSTATGDDAEFTTRLLESVGCACEVEEPELDAVTALSGSGPAYVFLLIESLVDAAVKQGLKPDLAEKLAVQTVAGAAEMVRQTGESPATLRENVTSPNGTTFAALESFRENGFARIVKEALDAARDRSVELGQ